MENEIIGIIVELNPLHEGHKRLIKKIKEENPNSIIVATMSGQFVQRGEISIYNKWERSRLALDAGINLVIEIPPYYVLNNANIFANEALKILNEFKVKKIYFGSENLSITKMNEIVSLLNKDKEKLDILKNKYHSLPKAFESLLGYPISSNDMLGICYLLESKNSNLKFEFHRIERENNAKYKTASSIREELKLKNKYLEIEDFSEIIIGKLITSNPIDNTIKYLKNNAINNEIRSFNKLIDLSKNSSNTKAKLRRELIKFTLELKKSNKRLILASDKKGNTILKESFNYSFRHEKDNEDNYAVESFLSLKSDLKLADSLSKQTIIKK